MSFAAIADVLVKEYANLRAPFFAGFISLSGFMLSVYTFIIVRMKESVYDHPSYKERIRAARIGDKTYQPFRDLRGLSSALFLTIISTVVTAAAQLTLGLSSARWAIIACYVCVGVSIGLVTFALVTVWRNLELWFGLLNEVAIRDADAEIEAARKDVEQS